MKDGSRYRMTLIPEFEIPDGPSLNRPHFYKVPITWAGTILVATRWQQTAMRKQNSSLPSSGQLDFFSLDVVDV